ncbi:MAG: isocitrate/isopropylmalate family dehydrogenase [Verrucomicrobia bacterium]|nr:isocitrate/isopropylmalate family dehydrogenase [Verrucomicrobiota bacterium]MDA1087496.1 isocitrate/isopropylmalate family dehydrogenase [Verrucomicrobiota bacterium]
MKRLSEDICALAPGAVDGSTPCIVGIVEGEGIGPEVTRAARVVLDAIQTDTSCAFDVRMLRAEDARTDGSAPDIGKVLAFCRETFASGGVVLAGALGGRHVYDLRREFDLYCKLVPLKPTGELAAVSRCPDDALEATDILLVRENVGGIYQGESTIDRSAATSRIAIHHFTYEEPDIRRLLHIATRLAARRSGGLTVIVKEGGAPAMSSVWREIATEMTGASGTACRFMNIDHAVYEWVRDPCQFDVVAAPNMFGDILADLGGALVGSRGVTFSGNFASSGAVIYQTNHGAAEDLAGRDVANPAGQIFSLAMLLRESFGLMDDAARIETAIRNTWRTGWRTADVAEPGCRVIGTQEMAQRIVDAVKQASEATAS